MQGIFRVIIVGLILCLSGGSLYAQQTLDEFGKNRIQYKRFDWRFYSSENFDIYFYNNGEVLAKKSVEYLEAEFDRITDILGYAPFNKTKIFLYNSITDLQQSNVGVNENNFSVGGQTNFIKANVEIAYNGTFDTFKDELIYQVSLMMINDMMFGGSLADMLQNSYLLSLPDWFVQGAAQYITSGWSVEMDDYVRDLFTEGKFKKLSHIEGRNTILVGQSLWNFVAEKYGVSSISNILNLTRIIRNEQNAVANTLGMPFRQVVEEWKTFYGLMADRVKTAYIFPVAGENINSKNRHSYQYRGVSISPDGRLLAYSRNFNGKYTIFIYDTQTGKTKRLYTGGYKVINQEYDLDIPLLAWQNETTLGMINTRRGQNVLWLMDVATGRRRKIQLIRFNQVKDFSFSSNGNVVVMSADLKGRNDIFFYSISRSQLRRITNDDYDDINPRFIPGANSIVFSSNRPTDTLSMEAVPMDKLEDNFNLFVYSADTTKKVLARITNTLSKDMNPLPENTNSTFYLSDQKGVVNLFNYDLNTKIYRQITNYGVSIKDYDVHFGTSALAFVAIHQGEENVYFIPDMDLSQNNFTPLTRRQEIEQAKFISRRIMQREIQLRKEEAEREKQRDELNEVINQEDSLSSEIEVINLSDTTSLKPQDEAAVIDLDQLSFKEEKKDTLVQEREEINLDEMLQDTPDQEVAAEDIKPTPPPADELTEVIDIDNYTFDTEEEEAAENQANKPAEKSGINSFLSNYRKLREKDELEGPFPYTPTFSANNLVTSILVDPLIGFSIQVETQMNDILENHKFFGGILTSADLRNSEFYGEYQFLKYRYDFHARYERRSILRSNQVADERYKLNRLETGISMPLSVKSRITLTPFWTNTLWLDLDPNALNPGAPARETRSSTNYLGAQLEFVYDNTLVRGLNILEGTKAKFSFEHHQSMNGSELTFSNFNMDVRHYQKIHREFTLAVRLFYGRFFGNNKQDYLVGGVDNWLFNKTTREDGDPLDNEYREDNSDILFVEYVTNLRGFNFNAVNGSNALILNAELRFPIIQYFSRGTVSSNFLRNFLLIGFYDIGSAWTGKSPFAEENDLNTEVIKRPAFEARIKNFSNPWLSSYGAGIRTVLLGYYMRLDMAWPIENYDVGKPRFQFSLGYDF